MLAQVDQPIHVVLVPDIFPGVERERRRLHARCGVTEIRVDQTIAPTLAVLRALSENGIVAMQGDRDFDNTGVADAVLRPRGVLPARAPARRDGLRRDRPAGVHRARPGGGYRAIVEEPLPIETAGERDAALRENLRRYIAILERYVRDFPEQWYCFYPFWDDPSRKVPAAAATHASAR